MSTDNSLILNGLLHPPSVDSRYRRDGSTNRTRSTGRFSTSASIAKIPVTVSKSTPVISR